MDRRAASLGTRFALPRSDCTPLDWAAVGSGEQPKTTASPDWTGTVRILLDAGAPLDGITLSPDEPKQPSPEVAALFRAHGVKGG